MDGPVVSVSSAGFVRLGIVHAAPPGSNVKERIRPVAGFDDVPYLHRATIG